MQKSLYLLSLGCTKNLVDSEVMLYKLKNYNLIDDPSSADIVLINTCGFIESAKTESINSILELDQERKNGSLLVVAGCLTERYKDEIRDALPEVEIFTGVGDYDRIDELVEEKKSQFSDRNFLIKDEKRVITNSLSHAFIKISEGCNQKCSFCAIPSFRGKLQSRDLEDIKNEVIGLTKEGFYDFTFISQDSSSYLQDKKVKDGLIKLIDKIDSIEEVKSARILYLYPTTTTEELIDRIDSSEKFHNYFDMPIQHIDNDMLKKSMKRGHGEDKIRTLVSKIKSLPNHFLRTAVIVGHPDEKPEDIDKLASFLRESEFDRVSMFEYSDEEGTGAFLNENKVPIEQIDKRIERLEEINSEIFHRKNREFIGKTVSIVVNSHSSEHEYLLSAKMLNWAENIDGEILVNDSDEENIEFGKIYRAQITDYIDRHLVAKVIEKI